MKNATMKAVAERAGVSLMTVSRVLNDTARVKPETRERVERAVADLDYRPNLGARRLAGGRSRFIGLLYHNPSGGYLGKVLRGALDACREFGHHLVLEDFGHTDPYRDPEEAVRALNLVDLDGVIVTPPLSSHAPFMAVLETLGVPVVRIAPEDIHVPGSLRVAMDDAQAVEDLLAHVVARGHTRIAFLKGPTGHAASQHRLDGFLRGMRIHGLPVTRDSVREGDFTYRSGLVAGRAMLRESLPPTAILAGNDDMAAGVVGAAHRLGMSVPEDVSVCGFDDTELATTIQPELTTVRQPIAAMAHRAMALLTAHLDGDAEAAEGFRGLMPYSIVQRDSVAAPKT